MFMNVLEAGHTQPAMQIYLRLAAQALPDTAIRALILFWTICLIAMLHAEPVLNGRPPRKGALLARLRGPLPY